jgi:arylsulfatase A
MNSYLKTISVLAGLFVVMAPAGFGEKALPPNIILIMADDLGYETIAVNGGESYRTPRLDRMAEQGARFDHCYAQPLCTPSRVQIMTGLYNVRNYEKFGILSRSERTFAHLLKERGYATCVAGKWQLGKEADSPQHFGFDEALLWQHQLAGSMRIDGVKTDTRYVNPRLERNGKTERSKNGEYAPDLMVDFISEFMQANREKPFLVYYPMILTHCPFVPTPDSPDWDPKSPGSPTYKGDAKYFGDMVTYMDKLVGRIADEVEALGLSERTVILFTGDNGTDKPVVSRWKGRDVAGAKGEMTDGGTRVPLIVRGPGVQPGQVIDDLVDFSDFLPTLAELSGVEDLSGLKVDGRSFLPHLRGEQGQGREWIYSWYSRKGQQEDARVFARNQRYKLYGDGSFFDIREDMEEKEPLRAEDLSPEQQEVRKKLRQVIEQHERLRP